MSLPATQTRPLSGVSSRFIRRSMVDLPGAGGADQEDELALLDVGLGVAEGDDLALVDLGDVFELDHGGTSLAGGGGTAGTPRAPHRCGLPRYRRPVRPAVVRPRSRGSGGPLSGAA